MQTLAVVEDLDEVEHARARLIARGVSLVHAQLGLQRVEEALLDGVVVATALAAHAADDAATLEHSTECVRGVLGAAIGVVDEPASGRSPADRHLERINDDRGRLALTHRPADDTAREEVERRREV